MGAHLSSFFFDSSVFPSLSSPSQSPLLCLGDLPESCVASIVANLDPPDICKFAHLNRAFRGASWADFVWESKLPSNYVSILQGVLGHDFPRNSSKREIFTRLCSANTFDGGTKKVWLDKITGAVCLSISSKGLAITGIDDRRYWNHIPTDESKFGSVAYLNQIWWFEVDGTLEFPLAPGKYSLYFRAKLGRVEKKYGRQISKSNTDNVHGWDMKPVQFQLWTRDGQHASSQCFLSEIGKWNLHHVGNFVVENSNALASLKFSMTQIDCTHTKGGICLDSVVVYPFRYIERLKHF